MSDDVENDAASEIIELQTVGIDIGSSTSHVMFAVIRLERDGRHLSSKYNVVDRRITFESEIYLTPFSNETTIDVDRLSTYIHTEYSRAGLEPSAIDTGAVIITGEAATKHNADRILELFAAEAGRFVCATAGPNLEAALAAHGSGAVGLSKDSTVLNVDIGGGTTKFALVSNGSILETAAVSLGARLISWDEDGRVERVERAASHYTDTAPSLGAVFSAAEQEKVAETMADRLGQVLVGVLAGRPTSPEDRPLYLTDPLSTHRDIDYICFSGGVSEYVYDNSTAERGDLGLNLGRAIRNRVDSLGAGLLTAVSGIRATIIGASQYTVQVSGNTISVSAGALLPLRNVPVLVMDLAGDDGTFRSLGDEVRRGFARSDLVQGRDDAALGVHWPGPVNYQTISNFCSALRAAMEPVFEQEATPLILLFDQDVAGVVGSLLAEEQHPRCPVVSVDQIAIEQWSYIDIGLVDPVHGVVPIVMKSLIFK